MSNTSLAHSNLSGVNLDNIIVKETYFWKADLSGQDFTVISNRSSYGSKFFESNLSHANFEDVDFAPKEIITNVFKNKAPLINSNNAYLIVNLLGEFDTISIISKEVSGNDLIVDYIWYNNLNTANLENANFKNAHLWFVNFYSADLTNANLSGADLSKAYLVDADLSYANLEGANLEGATLDNTIITGANLKCIGHPICEND